MVLEIRSIPVLTGETAERFVREAEENERYVFGECRIVCLEKVSYLCTVILNCSNYGTRQETIKRQAKVRRGCNRRQ